MKKWTALIMALLFLGGVSALKAEEGNKDEKVINVPVVKEYKVRMGTVNFPHAKHILDLQYNCGTCHHQKKVEKDGKLEPVPMTLEKVEALAAEGKNAFQCKTCHGDLDRKAFKKLFHSNCLGCHKSLKAENKKAPTKCKECHVKPKKKKAIEGC
ncbi:MAG: cytochrome c3 family protein [Thermodesulfobacteria bacterium]|nr:cytochrome c3 family protein [Thermodesulfobacteriota bacterium]